MQTIKSSSLKTSCNNSIQDFVSTEHQTLQDGQTAQIWHKNQALLVRICQLKPVWLDIFWSFPFQDPPRLLLSLVHTLQKSAPETGAINSMPDSGASFPCRLHLAWKKLAPNYGVEIDNGRRLRRSSFHPNVIITQFYKFRQKLAN